MSVSEALGLLDQIERESESIRPSAQAEALRRVRRWLFQLEDFPAPAPPAFRTKLYEIEALASQLLRIQAQADADYARYSLLEECGALRRMVEPNALAH